MTSTKPLTFSSSQFHVTVRFGHGIPLDTQGVVLLALEKHLRELTGKDVRVHKDLMGDDSKLRNMMTDEQRAKL